MKKMIFFSIIVVFSFFYNDFVRASDYDIYVDSGYKEDDSDGSSGKPYGEIEKAIEELGLSGGKIYIKNGTYRESFLLGKGMELYGQSRDKTIIQGTIDSEDDNKIKNLTISGKSYGISASGKIEVDNCKIKNSSKIGIDLLESGQQATITDSVISGNGKGLYIQRKRSISISGNTINFNDEEGIDIREKVNGTIIKNQISGNGEGGIEIIIGGSEIKISGNSITKNSASGIASQFYSFIDKTGSIGIRNNVISKNGKYGFTCGIPSGGNPSGSYWNESIELEENTIENNKIEAVNDICNMIEAVDEEEEKENITSSTQSKKEKELEVDEEAENEKIKEQILKETISEQRIPNSALLSSADETMKLIGEKNKIMSFLFGMTSENIGRLEKKQIEINKQAVFLDDLLAQTNSPENKVLLEEDIEKLKIKSESIRIFKEGQKNKFSLFGWVIRLFQ